MYSLLALSHSNQINREWIEEYLNEAHSKGDRPSIRAHPRNVMAWATTARNRNVSRTMWEAQLALMEAKPRATTQELTLLTLFWAKRYPVTPVTLPAEEEFSTFIEQALRLFVEETSGKDSPFRWYAHGLPPDRKPIIWIFDLPMKTGVITNRK